MRTVFLGTSDFAATVLRLLAASEHRPVLVVTRPDRPRGRGRRMSAPPAAQAAAELGIPVEQPASVNDAPARQVIAAVRPAAICVCAFGGLIKEPLLSSYRMLNVHPSLLPRWRGAAPIERAIMAGDQLTGVSIMQVGAGLDSGPVCAQVTEPIDPQDDYGMLARRLAALGGELLVRALSEDPPCAPQDESLATYAEKITPDDRRLDPTRSAAELQLVVRGLSPHVGAFVELPDGLRLGVLRARAVERPDGRSPDGPGDGSPERPDERSADGPLLLSGSVPVLECRPGWLELLVVKPAGRGEMSGEDWLRGLRP